MVAARVDRPRLGDDQEDVPRGRRRRRRGARHGSPLERAERPCRVGWDGPAATRREPRRDSPRRAAWSCAPRPSIRTARSFASTARRRSCGAASMGGATVNDLAALVSRRVRHPGRRGARRHHGLPPDPFGGRSRVRRLRVGQRHPGRTGVTRYRLDHRGLLAAARTRPPRVRASAPDQRGGQRRRPQPARRHRRRARRDSQRQYARGARSSRGAPAHRQGATAGAGRAARRRP